MKSKSFILMIVSLGFGLIAAIGISQVMGKSGPTQPKIEMGPVIVAVSDLDHNTVLTEEMVKEENWPLKIIPEDALTSLEEIKDQAVTRRMTSGSLFTRVDVIHKKRLEEREIPPGFRVYAMKVTAEETVGGLLKPGDFVDVIGTFRVKDRETDQQKTVSATFLKKIRVFNIDAKMNSNPDGESSGSKSSAIVGVLVRQAQAEQIALVEKEGTLKIIMRGENDDDDTPVDSLAKLLNGDSESDSGSGNGTKDDAFDVPRPVRTTRKMKLWVGNTLEVVTFKGDAIPQTTRYGQGNSNDSNDSNDSDDSADILDSEGDFEEDQYPGE